MSWRPNQTAPRLPKGSPVDEGVQADLSQLAIANAEPPERVWQHGEVTMPRDIEPSIVPELLVHDRNDSLAFWCGLCGFEVTYERADEGFAYIARGKAHLMLEQEGVGRNWIPAPLERPLGRGMNLQISVAEISSIVTRLRAADWPLFMDVESKWYRTGEQESGVEQFLVQDPDGYLIRFQAPLGSRAIADATEEPRRGA